MTNQKSHLSTQNSFREKFLIKRIDEHDIEITLEERNAILESLNAGVRFAQIGKYTLMLNAIKSIDPKYGAKNIPPRPTPDVSGYFDEKKQIYIETGNINQKELDSWDEKFGEGAKQLNE